jgi:hypothetical protein
MGGSALTQSTRSHPARDSQPADPLTCRAWSPALVVRVRYFVDLHALHMFTSTPEHCRLFSVLVLPFSYPLVSDEKLKHGHVIRRESRRQHGRL